MSGEGNGVDEGGSEMVTVIVVSELCLLVNDAQNQLGRGEREREVGSRMGALPPQEYIVRVEGPAGRRRPLVFMRLKQRSRCSPVVVCLILSSWRFYISVARSPSDANHGIALIRGDCPSSIAQLRVPSSTIH